MNLQAMITLRAFVFMFAVVPYWIGPMLINVLGRNPINRSMTGSQMAGLDNPLVVAFWVLFALWFFMWPFYAVHKNEKRNRYMQGLINQKTE